MAGEVAVEYGGQGEFHGIAGGVVREGRISARAFLPLLS